MASNIDPLWNYALRLQQLVATLPEAESPLKSTLDSLLDSLLEAIENVDLVQQDLEDRWMSLESSYQELLATSRQYEACFKLAPDGFLVTDTRGTVLLANRAMAKLLRVAAPDLEGTSLPAYVARHQRKVLYTQLERLNDPDPMRQFETHSWEMELFTREERHIDVAVTLSVSHSPVYGPQPVSLLWLFRDITERKRLDAQLHYQARHDSLTRLPNRSVFERRLQDYLSRDQHATEKVILILLDVDRFKQINDIYSHSMGDALLQAVAQRLASCIRVEDTLCRWGGDEFTLLLEPDMERDSHDVVAETCGRILDSLSQPFHLNSYTVHTSASIGVVHCRGDLHNLDSAMRCVDTALYESKRQGGNTYTVYNCLSSSQQSIPVSLEQDLRLALDQGQFSLHFQPQVDCRSQTIVAMEALARWNHPHFGLLAPETFISLAEGINFMSDLGEWVLQEAIAQAQGWHRLGFTNVTLAVNVSPSQVEQENFLGRVLHILETTGYSPKLLELEVTEAVAISRPKAGHQGLLDLAQMGVKISIDDFGTGYSSLSRLKQLPLHKLKVDRSLITDLGQNAADDAILTAIVALGQGLGVDIVAEGVETQAQSDALQALNCHMMQGYLFSEAVPADRAIELLNTPSELIAC